MRKRTRNKRKLWASLFTVLVVLALALAAACGDDDDDGAPAAAAAAQQDAAAAQQEIASAEAEAAAARAEAQQAQAAIAEAETEAEAAAARATAAEAEARAAEAEARAAEARAADAPTVQKTGIIPIGVVAPNSGSFEVFAHTYHSVAKLIEREVNDNLGGYCESVGICEPDGGFLVGDTLYKIRLLTRDDRSDINTSVAHSQELVRDVGIKFQFGSNPHDFAIAGSKITQPAKVMHFSGSSTLEEILQPEDVVLGGQSHYLFQTETREWQRSGSVAKGAVDLIDPNAKVSVLLMTNDATGQFLGPFYKRALEANGQEVPDIIFWPPETTDFAPFLTRAKALDPDIIHFWYDSAKALTAIPQALEIEAAKTGYFLFGLDPGAYKAQAIESPLPVAMACVPLCWGETDREEAKAFWKRYEAVGNELRVFSSVALLTYDDYYMLFQAMQDAGTVDDTDAIVEAILQVVFHGVVSDTFQFDAQHIVTHGTEVCMAAPFDGVGEIQFSCQFTAPPAEAPPGTPGFLE